MRYPQWSDRGKKGQDLDTCGPKCAENDDDALLLELGEARVEAINLAVDAACWGEGCELGHTTRARWRTGESEGLEAAEDRVLLGLEYLDDALGLLHERHQVLPMHIRQGARNRTHVLDHVFALLVGQWSLGD